VIFAYQIMKFAARLGIYLLATAVGAEVLVIATDVEAAMVGYGTPAASRLGRVSVAELRALALSGEFPSGSMGPKVEAAIRFVEAGGRRAVITSLDRIARAVSGRAGTVVDAVAEPAGDARPGELIEVGTSRVFPGAGPACPSRPDAD
jgi:carbamate kinase